MKRTEYRVIPDNMANIAQLRQLQNNSNGRHPHLDFRCLGLLRYEWKEFWKSEEYA
jgi:hypothetical protein